VVRWGAFLVLELAPGPTLAELLAAGPLEVQEALRLFGQMAEALESAHQKGIVHRDLKPANVKVTPEGKLKVLDFGLAKAFRGDGAPAGNSPTISIGNTRDGAILGTAVYMSPEQARGQPLDKRTDIWSFGCVLYEALAGRQAFAGRTLSDTLVSVLDHEPDWDAMPAATPPSIQLLLRRCVQKDRDLRGNPQTLGLMTGILADLAISRDGRQLALSEWDGSMNRTRLPLTAEGGSPAGPEEVLSRGQVFDRVPNVSPDGRSIAYNSNRLGHAELWMLHLDTKRLERLQLPGRDIGVSDSNWFPDGRRLVVVRNSPDGKPSLWIVAADGSQAEELVSPPSMLAAEGSPVSPDGHHIVYAARAGQHYQLFHFDISARQTRQLTFSADDKLTACWSPDGRWLYFQPNHLNMYRMPGEEQKRLTKRYTENPEAHQLYLRGRYYWNKRTPQGFKKAIAHFEQSLEKDPGYALAYAGMADCYNVLGWYGVLSPKESFPKSKGGSNKGVRYRRSVGRTAHFAGMGQVPSRLGLAGRRKGVQAGY